MPSTLKPEDFSSRTTDPTRHLWTLGKIEHVVAALQGRRVAVETDRMTGHVSFGVITGYAATGSTHDGARLHVKDEYGQTTGYYLPNVGVIVDLEQDYTSPKYAALAAARSARMAAIGEARSRVSDPDEGAWEAEGLGFGRYSVTRSRQGEPSYKAEHFDVTLKEAMVG